MNICLKCSIDVYLFFDVKIQTLKHKKDSALFPENVSVFSGLFPVFFSALFRNHSGKRTEKGYFLVWDLVTPPPSPLDVENVKIQENSEKNQGTSGGPLGTLYNHF